MSRILVASSPLRGGELYRKTPQERVDLKKAKSQWKAYEKKRKAEEKK